MEKTFHLKLRPWQAAIFFLAVSILLFASSYFRFIKAYDDSKKGADEIITILKSEKGQAMVKAFKSLDPYKEEDKKALNTAIKHHLNEINFELISYDVRGHWMEDMVFRLEYKVGGNYPDGEKYHYYRMPYSLASGWDTIEMYPTDESYYNSALWKRDVGR